MVSASGTDGPGDGPTSSIPVKKLGFISYAHDDHALFDEFHKYLNVVALAYPRVAFQGDPHIHGGQPWRDEILRMIRRADLFILLVTPAFLASEFIIGTELPAMRDRLREAGALLLPVVFKQCMWQWICHDIQALPTQNKRLKPVLDWRPRDNGYVQAQAEISAAIERFFDMPMSPGPGWYAKAELRRHTGRRPRAAPGTA
jgi:hypothetical protein